MLAKVVICFNNKLSIMKNQLNAVKEFHEAYGLGVSDTLKGSLGEQKDLLRYNLMKEENEEYLEATKQNDVTEIADALGDMLYILCGTMLEHGLQHKIEEVFAEIHRSNMSKLDENGKPIYREDGKVMKGPNYFKPNIEAIISSQIV
jgi:predicted HAD superfamily Cof-like phosphohydrolase